MTKLLNDLYEYGKEARIKNLSQGAYYHDFVMSKVNKFSESSDRIKLLKEFARGYVEQSHIFALDAIK